jgi:CIC family chloride channel protein
MITKIKNSYSFISKDKAHYSNLLRVGNLSIISILIGIIAGYGAIGFRYLIALFHNIFFLGEINFNYTAEEHMVSSYGPYIIFVPIVGMFFVNLLVENFANEARGHGVPEVINAILKNGGKIHPKISIVKAIASAISIGSGGSVGREGPIVQIGASFGSTIGQLLKLDSRDIIILVAAGVSGGIAGTFNAPIGGVAFAIELILPEFSIMTLMPLVVASTVSTYISTFHLGTHPAFMLPSYHLVSSVEFFFYILLGLLVSFVSITYIHTLYKFEDIFDSFKVHWFFKGLVGALLLGLLGYSFYYFTGDYYVFGVGYSFISQTLDAHSQTVYLLIALIIFKIIANSLTLAAGGSGGVFAPSLFIGVATGSLVGVLANQLIPGGVGPVSAYALVGMAAMIAGTTGASFTAIIMTFEMTRNYEIMLPLMLSVVIAHFITRFIYKENIYSKKLSRRGLYIQNDKVISIFKLITVNEIVRENFIYATPNMKADDVLSILIANNLSIIPVIDKGKVIGVVSFIEIYIIGEDTEIGDYVRKGDFTVGVSAPLLVALEKMEENDISVLVVVSADNKVSGIITKNKILTKYFEYKRGLLS